MRRAPQIAWSWLGGSIILKRRWKDQRENDMMTRVGPLPPR